MASSSCFPFRAILYQNYAYLRNATLRNFCLATRCVIPTASRTNKVIDKVDLADSVWIEVRDNVELYRFFKVKVEIK